VSSLIVLSAKNIYIGRNITKPYSIDSVPTAMLSYFGILLLIWVIFPDRGTTNTHLFIRGVIATFISAVLAVYIILCAIRRR
jgi:hypothetical protein